MFQRTVRNGFLVVLLAAPTRAANIQAPKPEVKRQTYPVQADNCRAAIRLCQVPEKIAADCPRSKSKADGPKPNLHIAGLTCSSFQESHQIRLLIEQRSGAAVCTAIPERIALAQTIRVYTPKWDMPEGISDAAKQVWTKWRKQIEEHEQKHVSIYLVAHAHLIKELKGVGTVKKRGMTSKQAEQAAGDELNGTIREITQRIMAEAEEQNRELDRKEGVITPPRCPDPDS